MTMAITSASDDAPPALRRLRHGRSLLGTGTVDLSVMRIDGAPAEVTATDIVRFLRESARLVERWAPELDRLDAALGDADHGENMLSGFQAVIHSTADDPPRDIGELLRRVGHTLISSVGGASGPLYGTAFIEAGIVLHGAVAADTPALARAVEAAAGGLARRGRCGSGDKTIYDALRPAADAVRDVAANGGSIGSAVGRAARAARHGALATTPLLARRGLALRLGERSRGHQDPGATSCALLFRACLTVARADRRARGPDGMTA